MKALVKLDRIFFKSEEVIITTCIWIMAVILVANVIGRTGFHRTLSFAEEVASIVTIFVTFVGTSYCVRIGRHITMTALYDALGPKGKKIFYLIVCLLTGFLMFAVAYISFTYVQELYSSGRVTNALLLPLWIPYLMIPLAFIVAGIQYLILFVVNLKEKDHVVQCLYPQEEAFEFSEEFDDEDLEQEMEGGASA